MHGVSVRGFLRPGNSLSNLFRPAETTGDAHSDDRGVRVTSTRLTVGNTTYAMANITSVSTKKVDPSYSGAGWTVIAGVVLFLLGFGEKAVVLCVLGLIVAGVGIYWATRLEPEHHLRIVSAAGESSPLSSKEKGYIEGVVRAIHEPQRSPKTGQ